MLTRVTLSMRQNTVITCPYGYNSLNIKGKDKKKKKKVKGTKFYVF